MPKITIYTTPICPYCARAKALLKKKGATFEEIDVFMNSEARRRMEEKASGRYTVPQIFIDGHPIGGFDEARRLDAAGELDPLLGRSDEKS